MPTHSQSVLNFCDMSAIKMAPIVLKVFPHIIQPDYILLPGGLWATLEACDPHSVFCFWSISPREALPMSIAAINQKYIVVRPTGLMLGAGFLALRVQVDVAEESGKRVRA
jgi:hypothetical protein